MLRQNYRAISSRDMVASARKIFESLSLKSVVTQVGSPTSSRTTCQKVQGLPSIKRSTVCYPSFREEAERAMPDASRRLMERSIFSSNRGGSLPAGRDVVDGGHQRENWLVFSGKDRCRISTTSSSMLTHPVMFSKKFTASIIVNS